MWIMRRGALVLACIAALYVVGVAGGWEFGGDAARASDLQVVR